MIFLANLCDGKNDPKARRMLFASPYRATISAVHPMKCLEHPALAQSSSHRSGTSKLSAFCRLVGAPSPGQDQCRCTRRTGTQIGDPNLGLSPIWPCIDGLESDSMIGAADQHIGAQPIAAVRTSRLLGERSPHGFVEGRKLETKFRRYEVCDLGCRYKESCETILLHDYAPIQTSIVIFRYFAAYDAE